MYIHIPIDIHINTLQICKYGKQKRCIYKGNNMVVDNEMYNVYVGVCTSTQACMNKCMDTYIYTCTLTILTK